MHGDDATVHLKHVEQRMRDLVLLHPGPAADAAARHLSAGGSRVRAHLALHACRALAVPGDVATSIAAACELLHNASLVHDDLQDRDAQRRGQDAVWRAYGDATAICCGDLLLSAAYGALIGAGPSAGVLLQATHRRVSAVIRGQCHDLAQQGRRLACLDTYEQVAAGKSGPLLVLPLELALRVAGRDDAVELAEQAGALFAVGYQAADDLDDVERDAISEELNVVAVLAALGHSSPLDAARELAIDRFERCAAAAAGLPSGSGERLGAQALKRAALLARTTANA
jgi:geranylgeranyl diphosphate synthase type II